MTRYGFVIWMLLCLGVASPTQAAGPIGPQAVASTPLAQGTKFVSNTGSGSACSLATPCSIFTAIGVVVPGDVVFMRGGVYAVPTAGSSVDFSRSGTANAKITWESYPGETAIFDGGALPEGTERFIRVLGNYQNFRKFEVRNMPSQGFYIRGIHNTVDGLYIHHNKISGLQIADGGQGTPYGAMASFNLVQNCTITDNSDVNTSGGGNADGISISAGTGNIILHNLVVHNSDDGIDTWKSQNAHVAYNISTNNGIGGGNGMGYKCGGAAPSNTQLCDHNISYNNRTAGFDTNSGANSTFNFNTSWNNDDAGFVLCTGAAACMGNTVVQNSLTLANSGNTSGTGTTTNNSWQRGGTPAFMSVDPTSPNFLRPTVGGGFEDIGAYAGTTSSADVTPPSPPSGVTLH